MTSEALSFTRSFSIALLALLEAMAPPAVSVGLLYGLSLLYGAEFKGFFVVLAILVGALSVLLPPPRARPPESPPQLLSPTWPLAGRVLVRWMVIVAILLAIGFVTKYTADFSRKIVLSWVITRLATARGANAADDARRILAANPRWPVWVRRMADRGMLPGGHEAADWLDQLG